MRDDAFDREQSAILGVTTRNLPRYQSALEDAVARLDAATVLADEIAALAEDVAEWIAGARPGQTIATRYYLDQAAASAAAAEQLAGELRGSLDDFDVVIRRHARKAAA